MRDELAAEYLRVSRSRERARVKVSVKILAEVQICSEKVISHVRINKPTKNNNCMILRVISRKISMYVTVCTMHVASECTNSAEMVDFAATKV